jgi:signal transduction histidine kinase
MNDYIIETLVVTILVITGCAITTIIVLIVFNSKARKLQAEKERLQMARINEKESTMKEIAEDLHDNLSHLVSFTQGHIKRVLEEDVYNDETKSDLNKAFEILVEIGDSLHMMARSLHSDYIKHRGLLQVLEAEMEYLSKAYRLNCWMEVEGSVRSFSPEKALLVYRIVHEAIMNSIKHASATNIIATFRFKANSFDLCINDDGTGFSIEDEHHTNGIGLINMKERALLLPGTLTISSSESTGTTIEVYCLWNEIETL